MIQHFIIHFLSQYGYVVLFVAFMLELIALPIPGEVILSYVGFLAFQGRLNLVTCILMAGLGAASGITIAYWIGFSLGAPFFQRYGHHFHMGPERMEKTSEWFAGHGNKVLVIAYFIPGIRHITGYFSGITRIPFGSFALRAYLGAFLYTGAFIILGKILGPNWKQFHGPVRTYVIIGVVILAVLLAGAYLYRNYKIQIKEYMIKLLNQTVTTFKSLGKVKVLISVTTVVFLGLVMLMAGLIQDYLANEFGQFNAIVIFLLQLFFPQDWVRGIEGFNVFASFKILVLVISLTLLWIMIKGKDRKLEAFFLLIIAAGGDILEEGLQLVFHRLATANLTLFPAEQSLVVPVVYGFMAYVLVRHLKNNFFRTIAFGGFLIILAMIGLSYLFLQTQYPSDILAGYVFGGVWLSLNILLMEIYRLFPYVKVQKKSY